MLVVKSTCGISDGRTKGCCHDIFLLFDVYEHFHLIFNKESTSILATDKNTHSLFFAIHSFSLSMEIECKAQEQTRSSPQNYIFRLQSVLNLLWLIISSSSLLFFLALDFTASKVCM